MVTRGDRTLDILILSGGGQHGAYGVGFLRGWRTSPDAPMPRFDLVTGVSAGALQAPFALLGTEAALDNVAALYRDAANRIVPTPDWLFWLRRTGGIVNTERYEAAIHGVMDERLQEQLRVEFDAGRRLVIATTDFDLGVGRLWDVAREMQPGATGLARLHTLLLATTAIPGIFPPVVIDGHVHADGGIVANLAVVPDLAGYRALAARLRALGVSGEVTVRVWVIMNLWTHPRPAVMDPASREALSQRSKLLLFWVQQPQLLTRLADLSSAVSADVPGLRMEMHYTAIPSQLSTEPGAGALFDQPWMNRLEQLGYERARGPAPWDEIMSTYERPPR